MPRRAVVVVQPFFTEEDADRVRRVVAVSAGCAGARRITEELLQYFDDVAVRPERSSCDDEAMIRSAGRPDGGPRCDRSGLRRRGDRTRADVVDRVHRTLAVPHAMAMTAEEHVDRHRRERAACLGENRCQRRRVHRLQRERRASFQRVFDQFVEVFSEREDVQWIVKKPPTSGRSSTSSCASMDS